MKRWLFALNLVAFSLSAEIPGLHYQLLTPTDHQAIHILEVDPQVVKIGAARAAHGKETAVAIAERTHALAAINGGFFHADGRPAGILKIDGEWLGAPTKPRAAIGWSEGGKKVLIDQVLVDTAHHAVLPQSSPPLTKSSDWESVDHIIGGTPLLLSRYGRITNYAREKTRLDFLHLPHARTAIGIRADGTWVFVVIEGHRHCKRGLTIPELAELMQDLKCSQALNMDGGGSCSLVFEGTMKNHSYLPPEKISDAFVIINY